MIDGQTDEDAGQCSRYHSQEVAEVEFSGVNMQVSGEAVLDACPNEPGGQKREGFTYTLKQKAAVWSHTLHTTISY